MMRGNRYDGFDERIARLIRRKAKQLVGKAGLTVDDRDDLEQDLALHLLRHLARFDPTLSQIQTFASRIIDCKAASILEARGAARRDWRLNAGSLNDVVDDGNGDGTERIETVDADECRLRVGRTPLPEGELRDLTLDVLHAVDSLPPELRELCIPLLAERVADVSRATGIPRGTIYERIAKIRARFEDAGLREYLR